jgi:hypothetical protein
MNPFEFVLVLMLMIFGFTLLKHKLGIPSRSRRDGGQAVVQDDAEKRQLLEEVRQLKDRVQVLERITVEKENSLARQIDELRDR